MKTTLLFLSALTALSTAYANEFCGKIHIVRFDLDDHPTSVVLKNSKVANDEKTKYNDQFLTIRAANNSVTRGYYVTNLVDELMSATLSAKSNYVWANQVDVLRKRNVWVCLKGFERTVRKHNRWYEQRANDSKRIEIKYLHKVVYKGEVESAHQIVRQLRKIESNQEKIAELEQDNLTIESDLQQNNPSQVRNLKKVLGL